MKVDRISLYTLDSGFELPSEILEYYSRMKYGDPIATKIFARKIAHRFQKLVTHEGDPILPNRFLVSSAAYGSIPTAAHSLTRDVLRLMRNKGLDIKLLKIKRDKSIGLDDYARLGVFDRRALLNERKLFISPLKNEMLKGHPLIIIDDLFATGSHESAILKLLDKVDGIKRIIFLYVIKFGDDLGRLNPMMESKVNSYSIQSFGDYVSLFEKVKLEPYLNVRVVKFLLSEGSKNKTLFKRFLKSRSSGFRFSLYSAAMSDDMGCTRPNYQSSINLVKDL